ncbi:MAG: hypothetical protein PHG36_02615 [Dehalococcoidia bacterium]|jgi:hypothetical protein|nr:hypothetical protein [Dehalococcoidia bacterium]
MKKIKYLLLALLVPIAGFINGCSDDITCADVDKITDPVQKEKLIKECPQPTNDPAKPAKKEHSTYKKSPVVNW